MERKIIFLMNFSTMILSLKGGVDGTCCFRLWETMTMGSVAVLEKGVGLDKPVRPPTY